MTATLFDLSDYGKIELAGPDSRFFLHNLCTQDVKDLPIGDSREAFLTTTKARIIAHVWITHPETDVLWLDMVAGQAEKVLQHLNHFLISEKVELTDRTHEFGLLRLVGPSAAELLTRLGITPNRRHRLLAGDGFDLFCPTADTASLRQGLLSAGAVLFGPTAYQIRRIEAGLPEFGIDIDENRLAMEVNRTAQAICYTKGCYLGQETIVMARDRGQVNRLLVGVQLLKGGPLAAGAKLYRANEEVGQVTSSVFSPTLGSAIALAYLRRGSWDPGTVVETEPTSGRSTAVVCALPFFSAGSSTLP